MSVTTIIILVLLCICASFIQRVSGFGFGVFIMTMLPFIMPSYGEATTLSGMLAGMQSLYVFIRMRRLVNWPRLLPILLTFLVVSFFAVNCVSYIEGLYLKQILGGVLIALSIFFLFISDHIHVRPTLTMQLSMGSLSGVMGGLFAMQGPPAVMYFVASERDKDSYMAMAQAYFFVGNAFMTIYRANSGFLTETVGICWLYALGGIIVGAIIGKMVFDRISIILLRKIIYIYMAISGLLALVL